MRRKKVVEESGDPCPRSRGGNSARVWGGDGAVTGVAATLFLVRTVRAVPGGRPGPRPGSVRSVLEACVALAGVKCRSAPTPSLAAPQHSLRGFRPPSPFSPGNAGDVKNSKPMALWQYFAFWCFFPINRLSFLRKFK